eukprot:GHVT01099597.1.p2 GENE.GHVT01099597.1~~GHVT01099597.1.p2  ORF type:complete len:121 (+),score=24.49 GHVT01099597.1:591-953(+)
MGRQQKKTELGGDCGGHKISPMTAPGQWRSEAGALPKPGRCGAAPPAAEGYATARHDADQMKGAAAVRKMVEETLAGGTVDLEDSSVAGLIPLQVNRMGQFGNARGTRQTPQNKYQQGTP